MRQDNERNCITEKKTLGESWNEDSHYNTEYPFFQSISFNVKYPPFVISPTFPIETNKNLGPPKAKIWFPYLPDRRGTF